MAYSHDDILTVDNLGKMFGGLHALSDYSITIARGELVGLIGPNGAGKTTPFNLLSGVLPSTSGRVVFRGQDITRLKPDRIAKLGIARTFQNIRLFGELSVLDNIRCAFHMHMGRGLWRTILHTPTFCKSEREIERRTAGFLDLLDLDDVRFEAAMNLPYGVQRRVEIARALACNPRLLLLDEPAAGMNTQETEDLIRIIRRIHKEYHLTIFLVEHDMNVVMKLCERIQVLNQGRVLTMGTPKEIQSDQRVIEAYLGTSREVCIA